MSETSEKITTAAPLADLIDARLSRRSALKGLFAAGVATVAAPAALAATRSGDPSSLPFAQAPHTIEMFHQVAPGHRADVLIRWGDKVLSDAAAFDPFNLSADAQEKQFGYNNDFVAFLPLPRGSKNRWPTWRVVIATSQPIRAAMAGSVKATT